MQRPLPMASTGCVGELLSGAQRGCTKTRFLRRFGASFRIGDADLVVSVLMLEVALLPAAMPSEGLPTLHSHDAP
jgi:hypothetical protein